MDKKLNSHAEGEFIALYVTLGMIKPPSTILILDHVFEGNRHKKHVDLCRRVAEDVDAECRVYSPNQYGRIIRIESEILTQLINRYVVGEHIHEKRFAEAVFDLDDTSLGWIADGLLNETVKRVDGMQNEPPFRVEFCRDNEIVPDLKRMCDRLGYELTLDAASMDYGLMQYDSFVGELKGIGSD